MHFTLVFFIFVQVMASLNNTTLDENTILEINPEDIANQVSEKLEEMSTFQLFQNVSFMGGEYPDGKIAFKEDLLKPFCIGGNLNEFLHRVFPGIFLLSRY